LIRFNLRNLILFELLSTLLLSLGIGFTLFFSDLSSFWRERYSLDSGVIRQIFLDHRREISGGNTGPFESALAAVAAVNGIRFLEITYEATGKTSRLSQEPGQSFPNLMRCHPPGLSTLLSQDLTCFQSELTYGRSQDPSVSVHWWVLPEGLARQKRSALLLFCTALLLGLAFCGLHWLLIRKVIVAPISRAVSRFEGWVRTESGVTTPAGGGPLSRLKVGTAEINDLVQHFDQLLLMAQDYRQMREATLQLEVIDLMAKQVSHDLRSPLSALRVAVERLSKQPSSEARALALSAFQRVNDILATLGRSGRPLGEPALAPTSEIRVEDILCMVESIVAEHQLLVDEHTTLRLNYEEGEELFVRVDGVEIRRALSNLLNNALEALPCGRGQVLVRAYAADNDVHIAIEDNGVGIPAAVLERFGQKGVTAGKDQRSVAGSGLGVFQAKTAVEACGGRIVYTSECGRGTTVTLRLPKAAPPPYWAHEIPCADQVVVVDDDLQMHLVWREKFRFSGAELRFFLNAFDFELWYRENATTIDHTVFLLDFALGAHQPSGLELIARNSLDPARVVIVTAIASHRDLQIEAERVGVRLMSKQAVPFKHVSLRQELLHLQPVSS
jgi:signal transduction histidine kinase